MLLFTRTISITIFLTCHHPLLIVFPLILQTRLIFLLAFLLSLSRWYSYLIFLILVGGLLVVFIYLTALVPNEVNFLTPVILLVCLRPIVFLLTPNTKFATLQNLQSHSLTSLISLHLSKTIILMLIYFLICMFVVIFLINKLKSPLKIKIYVKYSKNTPTFENSKLFANWFTCSLKYQSFLKFWLDTRRLSLFTNFNRYFLGHTFFCRYCHSF